MERVEDGFEVSADGYLKPKDDETFDGFAAGVMRDMLRGYQFTTPDMRSLLENVAIMQKNRS